MNGKPLITLFLLFLSAIIAGQNIPNVRPMKVTINQDYIESDIYLNKGDFVCFIAEGVIKSANIYSPFIDGGSKIYPGIPATGLPFYDRSATKIADFAAGCLFAQQGGMAYPTIPLSSDENDLGSLLASAFGIGNGFYFVAQEAGSLAFGINTEQVIAGAFTAEVYVLTEEQHRTRNQFNKCPKTMKGKFRIATSAWFGDVVTEALYTDPSGNNWYRDTPASEQTYHNGMPTFRGLGALSGCQCSYKKNFSSTVTESSNAPGSSSRIEEVEFSLEESDGFTVGSFDFGYYNGNINNVTDFLPLLKSHFIMDVYPHRAYLRENQSFVYNGTRGY